MRWVFDDGTVVHLGGKVEGNSPLAKSLRQDVAKVGTENPLSVQLSARPSPWVAVDLRNPLHVDEWLRNEPKSRLVEFPALERPVRTPSGGADEVH